MRYVVVAALAALVASAAPVAAQSTGSANGEVAAPTKPTITKDSTGRILGVLDADTGSPVVGAEVIDKVTGVTAAFTNEHGVVRLGSFRSQDDSSVVVTIRKIGYQDTTLRVIKNDTTPITLMLEASVPVLPTMIAKAMAEKHEEYISPLMQGFERRMNDKSLSGVFFPPDLLRKYDHRYISNILSSRGIDDNSRGCNIGARVFLDGRFIQWGIPTGLQAFSIEAMEYYSSASTPEEFGMAMRSPFRTTGVGGCGVLLLWSRVKA